MTSPNRPGTSLKLLNLDDLAKEDYEGNGGVQKLKMEALHEEKMRRVQSPPISPMQPHARAFPPSKDPTRRTCGSGDLGLGVGSIAAPNHWTSPRSWCAKPVQEQVRELLADADNGEEAMRSARSPVGGISAFGLANRCLAVSPPDEVEVEIAGGETCLPMLGLGSAVVIA